MPGSLTVFHGTAVPDLAANIVDALGLSLGSRTFLRFPDGELEIELRQSVRGDDVYLVQSTSPPADKHLIELLLLADACHRSGAARITAVVPYFGYARQDRRTPHGHALGGRVAANMIQSAPIDRLVVVDLHTAALEGFFSIPIEHVSAVPLLADAVRRFVTPRTVVVAPDLGAVKLAEQYARLLNLPIAIAHKTRITGHEVAVEQIVGDVAGRCPLVIDDMISTGGTVDAVLNALSAHGCGGNATVAATHGLFVGEAEEILLGHHLQRIVTTDTVAQRPGGLPIDIRSLGALLADTIQRLHSDRVSPALTSAAAVTQ